MITAPAVSDLVISNGAGQVSIQADGLFGPTLRHAAGLPATDSCDATFHVATLANETHWCRRYLASKSSSQQWQRCDTTVQETPAGFIERRGPITVEFKLTGPGQATLAAVRIFGLRLPQPLMSGTVQSTATEKGLRTTVTLALGTGRFGRLRYAADLVEVTS